MAKAIRNQVRNGEVVSALTASRTTVNLARNRHSVRARGAPATQADLESTIDELRTENRQLRVQLHVATGGGIHTPVIDLLCKIEQVYGSLEILMVAHDGSVDPPEKKYVRSHLYMVMDSLIEVTDTLTRFRELVQDAAAKEASNVG